jgi:hypothetical protein
VPAEIMAEYSDLHGSHGGELVEQEYFYQKAMESILDNKITRGLNEFEEVVKKYPFSVTVQSHWKAILVIVQDAFVNLATVEPLNSEVYSSFKKMRELSIVGIDNNVMFLRHLVRTGQLKEATPLAIDLLSLSPHVSSLQVLSKELLTKVDNKEIEDLLISSSSIYKDEVIKRHLNIESASFLWKQYVKVKELFSNGDYEQCFESISEILPKGTAFDYVYKEFYYHEALCLEQLQHPLEALNKLLRITHAIPEWIQPRAAIKGILSSVVAVFMEKYKPEDSVESVTQFYEFIKRIGYVPRGLSFFYLNILAKDPNQKIFIETKMKSIARLYPNDLELILELYTLGYKIKSRELVSLANKLQEETINLRPWDLELRTKLVVKLAS